MTGSRTLMAGLGAGIVEAVIAVTPSETIKSVISLPHQESLCVQGLMRFFFGGKQERD